MSSKAQRAYALIPSAVAGEGVPIEAYREHASLDPDAYDSDNFQWTAVPSDAWNAYHRKPSLYHAHQHREFFDRYLGKIERSGFMLREQGPSYIYGSFHQRGVFAVWTLAKRAGWTEVAAKAARWLRVYVRDCALAGSTVTGAGFRTGEDKPGPRMVSATGAPWSGSRGLPTICTAAQRAVNLTTQWLLTDLDSNRNAPLLAWALGLAGGEDGLRSVLSAGEAEWPLSPGEIEQARRALAGDVVSLVALAGWEPDYPNMEPWELVRGEGFIAHGLLHAHGSSTQHVNYRELALPSGAQRFLVHGPGGRDGRGAANQVGPCTLTLDWQRRQGVSVRIDGEYPPIAFELPARAVSFHARHDGQRLKVLFPVPEPTPVPTPTPTNPEPRPRLSLWQRFLAWLRRL